VEYSRANPTTNCETWLENLNNDPKWNTAIAIAKNDFAVSVECLKNGKSSPTFRRLFAMPEQEDILKKSAAYHRQNPDVSPELHLRRKHLALHRALEKRTLIYLDTNHWINLRHVYLNDTKAQPAYRLIFQSLNQLAMDGHVLCPVSFPLFIELMKQNDETTRMATARLMDAFAGGVCFQNPLEIAKMELRQQSLRVILGDKAPDLSDHTWTKVGYIGGELLPFNKSFSEEDMRFLQKLSIDGLWETPLDFFAEFDPSKFSLRHEDKLAAATNADAEWYRTNKVSFEEAFAREKAHQLRLLMKEMEQAAKEIWDAYPEYRDVSKLNPNQRASPWVLPSLQVLGGINAVLITGTKKFSANDMLDFQHAALAVPYSDALFCDGPMAHVLENKPLEFGKVYETKILSKPDRILDYLQNLK
jgi:hypothetical protein